MTLAKWDPWQELDTLFNRYTRATGWPRSTTGLDEWMPHVDIMETEKDFVIKMELPEVKKEDLKVVVDQRVLTIQGERKQETEAKGKKFHRVERRYGSFARSFTLPDTVAESHVQASYQDGVLKLVLPKHAPSTPKALEVPVQ